MDPKVVQFLYFNGFVVATLVAYIKFGRSSSKPSRLKLRGSSTRDTVDAQAHRAEGASAPERQLNVIFQFNGHDFDAYEVLGLTAGVSKEHVTEAYYNLVAESDHDCHEFYKMAFESICKK